MMGAAAGVGVPGAAEHVLVVDDDPELREALQDLLEMNGHAVQCAANGKEALALLRRLPAPCVVLLDLMMPVMDGRELLRLVREDTSLSSLPVIVISAAAAGDQVTAASAFLKKPFSVDAVLTLVRRHCQQSR